jgi:hypothetical protein
MARRARRRGGGGDSPTRRRASSRRGSSRDSTTQHRASSRRIGGSGARARALVAQFLYYWTRRGPAHHRRLFESNSHQSMCIKQNPQQCIKPNPKAKSQFALSSCWLRHESGDAGARAWRQRVSVVAAARGLGGGSGGGTRAAGLSPTLNHLINHDYRTIRRTTERLCGLIRSHLLIEMLGPIRMINHD